MTQNIPTPAALVTRILSGDPEAERLFVERYDRPIRAVLRQRLRQQADVEDFVQDTLGLALSKIRDGQVREPDKLGSFLMSMARNLVIEHFRRLQRRRTDADSDRVAEQAAPASDLHPGTEARLLANERTQLVHRMLLELETPRDRDILTRFYLQEEEKDSICDDLGLSALHFNRVLHRARQRYKKAFEDHHQTAWSGPPRPGSSQHPIE